MMDMGIEIVNLCMDMQLYEVTKQVCWIQTSKFHNIVVYPGGMHIMCFFRCIGTSALEFYVSATYGEIIDMLNGKSWVKAITALSSVAAVLLQQYLPTGQKTFDDTEYCLVKTCMLPTSRYWVTQCPPTNTLDSPVWAWRAENFLHTR